MARKSKEAQTDTVEHVEDVEKDIDSIKEDSEKIKDLGDLMDFEVKTLDDFKVYNKAARRLGRPVKVPDENYHKKIKVRFQRFDQPDNVLKAHLRNAEIDWTGQLKPGGIYHLPWPVIQWLNNLAVPQFGEVKVNEGGETLVETRQIGEKNRFSCQVLEI